MLGVSSRTPGGLFQVDRNISYVQRFKVDPLEMNMPDWKRWGPFVVST